MNSRSVIRDSVRTLFATGVFLLSLNIIGVLTVRLLGVNGRGEVAAAVLIPTIIANGFVLGIPVATAYLINAKQTDRGTVIGTARTVAVALSLALGLISVVICWFFPVHDSIKVAATVFSFYVPFNIVLTVQQ
jgi:O-antigen/teichoic acid export membrane protein